MKHFKPTVLWVVCLVGLFSFLQLYAQDAPDQQEATEQEEAQRQAIITVAVEVTNGNFDVLNEYVAEDYVVHTPLGDLDRESLTGLFMGLSSALTDFDMVRHQVLVEGNFAASRFAFTGIFENDFDSPMGVLPPTGEPFALEVINIFQFDDDGMIIEEWVQYDVLSFLTQLGAMGDGTE